ncbi:MAG: hypothetical protein PHQ40_00315 [Anaerolineaceae bacterium]|nr:hypothetical protein [Anaerolineaceae bacterium]MDD5367499.1 hypothetical protein [Anaerolineaceae bacterium]
MEPKNSPKVFRSMEEFRDTFLPETPSEKFARKISDTRDPGVIGDLFSRIALDGFNKTISSDDATQRCKPGNKD